MTYIISRLGHLGDGIAPGPVFVPLTLPGEEVDGTLTGDRIEQPRIVTPSPDRVRPPCRHFKACGGCALQHASDAFVADWKRGVVVTALQAQGIETDVRATITSPPASRRRATLGARRTKKGALVGLHARASDTLIEIPGCTLLHPDILATIPAIETICIKAGTRKGTLRVTVTQSVNGPDVGIEGGKPLDGPLRILLAQLAEQFDLARLSWDGEQIVEARQPEQQFGPARVVPPPGAFLQATPEGEAALVAAVAEATGPAKRIADLFAGCGTFALPLSQRADVHAVEGLGDLLGALDRGWRHTHGLHRITTETRDLFRQPLLPDELARHDAVVIDPPRAGCEAQAHELARSSVARVAAVSCNPVTFARDAAILIAGGYQLDWVQVVDQFRWSPHVELAAQFTRRD